MNKQGLTLTLEDVRQYIISLPDGAVLPHPNHKGNEDGLLSAALRFKYSIPETQNIHDSTMHSWLDIHKPGEGIKTIEEIRIYNIPEVENFGCAYHNYWERGYFPGGAINNSQITKEMFIDFWKYYTEKPLCYPN